LSETLLSELDPFGVKVSVVCPASFPSNLLKTIRSSSGGGVNTAKKLMNRSPVNADDIASMVYDESRKGKHIIIPTRRESLLWKLKRYFPGLYYIFMKKLVHKIVSK
jgi:short-subunit dehydrogenase